jgi:glycosyltransferase involved in cell wall biosynthesis/peptidoglycan/xylan/chitin deacetylase (PgdA/CDA1 family)
MKFSIVIATYQRREVLARTLAGVFAQQYPPEDFEVVVVVDGSTDGTAGMLRDLSPACAMQVVEQPNRGLAAARNAGLTAAKGQIVLFLDDDIDCDPGMLRAHAEAHAAAGAETVVFGPVLVAADSPRTLATEWTRSYTDVYVARLNQTGTAQWPRDMVMEANYSAPRSVLLAVGGNDERFIRRRQSADLGMRLHKAGVPFRYAPQAIVRQYFVKTSSTVSVHDAWWYGRSEVLLCRKHPEYRSHSIFSYMSRGPRWMPWARQVCARVPFSPEPLLRLPFWLTERLAAQPLARRAGLRLLGLRHGISMFRGAVAESGSWNALRREFGRRIPVLLYHHVGAPVSGPSCGLTVSPAKFAAQMDWLKQHGYSGINASQWLTWLREGEGLPPKPVLLTFDDALADLAENAFPVLLKCGFSATVFVVTQQVGKTNSWSELDPGIHRCLDASQIRNWAGAGIEFGAHSRTHADLTRLSADQLFDEVQGSSEDLSDLLGAPVSTFAYPFGRYNAEVVEAVRRVFDLAFTTDEGVNDLGSDRYRQCRTMALPSDIAVDLAARLKWGWSPLYRVRARLRVRSRMRALVERHA